MPWRTTFAVQSGGNHSGVQKKLLIASVAVAVIALAGSGALYGYDVSRSDVIAKGVSIGPLDVSGLSAHSARRLIRARLAPRLERPVDLGWRSRRWRLSPRAIGLRVDVERVVNAALDAGRHGTFIGRAIRDLRGEAVHTQIGPRV